MSKSIPGAYFATAHKCLDLKDARTVYDAHMLLLGSIANSLAGLLAISIQRDLGVETLAEAVKDL